MSERALPVLAIRPEPGLSATVALGRQMGLTMHGFALARVFAAEWELPSLQRFDAVLLGSANAIRMGGDNLARLTHLPVHAVGEATAKEAQAAGFTVAKAGKGGLQSVLDEVKPPIHYLRLVGSEYVELNPPDDVTFEPFQVYAVKTRSFLEKPARLLDDEVIVLLHSAAMTRQFVAECNRLEVDRSRITLAAMGARIAEPAGEGWRAVHVSPDPNDATLLAMVRELCL